MFNYNEIEVLHLEVTSKCQAHCPMCARNIQGGVQNPFITLAEISLEQFKYWFPKDFIENLKKFYICGNLGDPILAKDIIPIFSYVKSLNPGISCSINTNGSARSFEFWSGLASLDVKVRFGIDGLADTHPLYRIGTNWNVIIKNCKTFIDNNGYAIWDMLVFKHNEHQINDCRNLSIELGFKEFYSKHTARFRDEYLTVIDKNGMSINKIYPTEKSKQIKPNLLSNNISCKSKSEKSIYVSATGNLSPCCWLDNSWGYPQLSSRIDYMDRIGKYYNLNNHTLQEIFNLNFFNQIEGTWCEKPLIECSKQCGTVDRFNEQFK